MPGRAKPGTISVSLETSAKKVFASAIEWPGWSRSGKTEELAVTALESYAPRYATVASAAGERFSPDDYDIVERVSGGSGTDFGVPSSVTDLDRRPVAAAEAERLAHLVEAAWDTFAAVAAGAPAELRKGPRGGGRDRDKMIGHVAESDAYYAHEIGITGKRPDPTDDAAIATMRAQMLEILRAPSDGSALAGRTWTPRYAARRIAWHALDHAWEMEDRSDPD